MPTNETTEIAAEKIATISPSKASFSTGGGAATMEVVIPRVSIGSYIQNILGSVEKAGDGSLKRKLPAAHPYYDWLYATRISNIEGITPDGLSEASNYQRIIQTHFKDVAIYKYYKLTIEFEPRPYLIIDDASLAGQREQKVHYYNLANDSTNYIDCKEWYRFVEISLEPGAELLTTAVNNFVFVTTGASPNQVPVSNQNGGGVNITISKPVMKLKWYFVPYEVVFSKNIEDALGKVNQYLFFNYTAGSLLFKGVEVEKYSPPYQAIAQSPLITRPESTRLCDVTFTFQLFSPSPNDVGTTIPARSGFRVPYGHNLIPFPGDLKFHYAEMEAGYPAGGRPVYPSYPMEKLFLLP
jgi:hypothetical protein